MRLIAWPAPDGLVAPAMEQIQQPLRIGGLLLERLALQAMHQAPATSVRPWPQPVLFWSKAIRARLKSFPFQGHPIC